MILPTQELKGIIVGCSEEYAWLLPWWWMHYRMHNNFPVTFFDFGNWSETTRNLRSQMTLQREKSTLLSIFSIEIEALSL